ncbi:MAG TPA: AMP-binding protein, partial [Candidatus Binataceae bacterium]|nr:AMP-binding protein [Candidatus Binataceae bacterium]
MPQSDPSSLWDALTSSAQLANRFLRSASSSVALSDLAKRSALAGRLDELRDRSVVIATRQQFATALALVELDGVARRVTLYPGGLSREHLSFVVATAQADAVVCDKESDIASPDIACAVVCDESLSAANPERGTRRQTEWILLTSGTTGLPKLTVHTLATLSGAIMASQSDGSAMVWSTFYDIRRYGGLQIFLRALLAGASMVLSSSHEPLGDFLMRAGAEGVTHISGTPSHWRRVLMSPMAGRLAPRYVRLSGEIVDQGILDNLRAAYREATIVHAFASTEAGVGFDVHDGRAGFPGDIIGRENSDVEMKIEDGTLRIRSPRTALGYLGSQSAPFADRDGFVDTGDLVELRGERYCFAGRRDGVINVGGAKVHPEEVEAVLNRHPQVQMSLVRARKNPITGAIVVADIVLKGGATSGTVAEITVKQEL